MGPGYDISAMMEEFEELMGMSLFSTLLSEIPSMLIDVAVYVFTALSLYTIAKRRGINKPWLAWIPVVNVYIIGCISDQYRQVAKGETKSRRKSLLSMNIVIKIMAVVVVALCCVMLINLLGFGLDVLLDEYQFERYASEILTSILTPVVGMVLVAIPMAIVAIIYYVFYYIALHDVFKSCDPANATLYLVLSIFIGITLPVFLFLCRQKDDGMPARREEPAYEQPQWEPVQPPKEPWEQ